MTKVLNENEVKFLSSLALRNTTEIKRFLNLDGSALIGKQLLRSTTDTNLLAELLRAGCWDETHILKTLHDSNDFEKQERLISAAGGKHFTKHQFEEVTKKAFRCSQKKDNLRDIATNLENIVRKDYHNEKHLSKETIAEIIALQRNKVSYYANTFSEEGDEVLKTYDHIEERYANLTETENPKLLENINEIKDLELFLTLWIQDPELTIEKIAALANAC